MMKYLRTVREYLKYLPANLLNFHNQGNKQDIFIFATPRSGSTWLMELISSQPNIKFINEPLHINRHKGLLTNFNPQWEEIYCANNRGEKFIDFFSKLIDEKIFVGQQKLSSLEAIKNFDFFTSRKVFKVLRAKDIINQLQNNLEIKVVYLLRHPIPVALSWQRNNFASRAKLFLENDNFKNKYLNQHLIDYIRYVLETGSQLEIITLQWCLDNLAPIKFLDKGEWLTISYEELVMNQKQVLDKLYFDLELDNWNKLCEQASIPSKTTSDNRKTEFFNRNNRDYLIKKWKNKVSDKEEEKVFSILNEFDIDIYQRNSFLINKKSDFL
ncbi:MAG: sulfotransferase domain-containing protein [Bacillota bacterium]